MSSRRSSALVAAVVAVTFVSASVARAGSALIDRFTPESGGFAFYTRSPVLPTPNGNFFFALAANRLLCTVDATTGAYVSSIDIGLEAFGGLERQPIAPMTLSKDGKVLALPAAGAVRFFDVEQGGRLTARSEYPAPTGATSAVGLTSDGKLAVVAVGSEFGIVASVRTSDAKELDSKPLGAGEAPIHTEYSPQQSALSIVTPDRVVVYRHDERGKLKRSGQYERQGFVGDAFSGIEALGKGGRVIYTVEEGGSALIGVNLKGKQTGREAAQGTNRFSSPVAVSPDGGKVAVASVSGLTGASVALVLYNGDGKGPKGQPSAVALDSALGPVGQVAFNGDATLVAASFPTSDMLLLVDVEAEQIVGTRRTSDVEGLVFATNGRTLFASREGGVDLLPVSRRGFDEAAALAFDELPGAIFGPADRAFAFPSRFFGIASSGATDAMFTFNASSGGEIQRVDVGASTGWFAVAPDAQTIVASGGGGLLVLKIDDSGRLTARGSATPGAIPPDRAPAVAFHPVLQIAYVTAGASVWRVDLTSGGSTEFAIGGEGATLTNPAVAGGRLYAIENGTRMVRCSLDGAGQPAVVGRTTLDVTLDAAAPRVAYDVTGGRMWAADGDVVRQYDLFTGIEVAESETAAIGRAVVLVAPDLLAAIPDGAGSVVFYDLSLRVTGQADVSSVVSVTPAVDSRRLYLSTADGIVAVEEDGTVTTLDDSSTALHLSFTAPLARLVYPDLLKFPGSVVIATGF